MDQKKLRKSWLKFPSKQTISKIVNTGLITMFISHQGNCFFTHININVAKRLNIKGPQILFISNIICYVDFGEEWCNIINGEEGFVEHDGVVSYFRIHSDRKQRNGSWRIPIMDHLDIRPLVNYYFDSDYSRASMVMYVEGSDGCVYMGNNKVVHSVGMSKIEFFDKNPLLPDRKSVMTKSARNAIKPDNL